MENYSLLMGDNSVDEDGGGVDGGAFRGHFPAPAGCRNETPVPDLGLAMAAALEAVTRCSGGDGGDDDGDDGDGDGDDVQLDDGDDGVDFSLREGISPAISAGELFSLGVFRPAEAVTFAIILWSLGFQDEDVRGRGGEGAVGPLLWRRGGLGPRRPMRFHVGAGIPGVLHSAAINLQRASWLLLVLEGSRKVRKESLRKEESRRDSTSPWPANPSGGVQGDPPTETETDEVKNVYVTRKARYSQVRVPSRGVLEADLQKRFEHHDPHELVNELKAIFETHAAVECYEASKHFFSCMMEEGSSSEHMLAMTGHAKKLSDLGIVIPNRLGINRVLQSPPPSYKNFVMNYNMQNMNKELPELFGMLKAAEIEIKKEHQVLMVNKTTSFKKQGKSKGKFKKGGKKAATPPMKPKNGPKPDAECYYCKEKGHWKRNCSKYLADLKSGLVKKKKEETAAFTLNRAPSKSVETTPYELWFNKKPKLSFLKVWGCEAYVKKSEGKIFVAKNGTFLEKEFLTKEVTGRKVELDEIDESLLVDQSSAVPEVVPVPPTPATEEANDNDHETLNEETTEPRRSTRECTTPDWYDPCLNVMIVDNNDEDPATYEEAMMSPDSNKWQEAMKSEMGSMYDNKVWTLVDLPDSRKAVENKWIFKRKTDADGNITVYKARLVAKGFRQIQGVDYDEIFSPVAKLKSMRILLAIAAFFDYEIWQMDVKMAFLNGDIEEELYMCTVAKSSTESEYIVASEASSEAVWMKRFIVELGVVPSALDPLVIYCDNMGAIANAQEPRSHKRLKHIKLRYHSIREYIEDGEVKICKVHTDLNVADPLTKALPRAKHDQHQNTMGVRYLTM
ncbi:hypothetical protein QYE76_058041 [Lolium multiflorum]|uniref:CCHC-type domain-containing protein n=1 Tax=Lolium multiflorum TaxID=4521 RepID=A0AAD8T4G3_LOLMU|nr:hypothetical protein QYE76_058041 [Lolium multiflorum]